MNIKFLSIAFSLLILMGGTAFAQKLIPFETAEGSGYKDVRGRVVIPAKYRMAEKFSKEGLANVVDDKGWALIDRTGRIVIRTPFIFDNGPDYYAENLARFTENDKFGFYDKRGKIIIAAKFDFALPFSEGLAAVCLECRKTKPDADGHYAIVGGRWGFINRTGTIVIPLRFEAAESFEKGRAAVRLNNKPLQVDKRGRTSN